MHLAGVLPEIKLVDFFKTLVQLGGLNVHCDAYEDYLYLTPSRAILDNVHDALDWTSKRDTPPGPAGQARKVAYRFGGYAQRNWLRYSEDETVTKGYGDGSFRIADESLPRNYEILKLSFAATEKSKDRPDLLKIANYKIRENEDSFADVAYDRVVAKPRLTLASKRILKVTLSETTQVNGQPVTKTRPNVDLLLSTFDDPDEEVSLNADTYVLPTNWAGLQAMLTDLPLPC